MRASSRNLCRPQRRWRRLRFEALEERSLLNAAATNPAAFDPSSMHAASAVTEVAAAADVELSTGAGMSMARQMEHLNRGIVALRTGAATAYVGWKMLGTDPADIAFNLYRSAGGGAPVKINASPLTQTTDFVDSSTTGLNLKLANNYFVRPILDGLEQAASESFVLPANAPTRQYLNVPLQRPAGGTVSLPAGTQTPPSGTLNYTYHANDASVGDLDGDGQYEVVLKWDPTNSQDNSAEGLTGNVLVDAYQLDGTRLWRIDLGPNIRAGAHYTPLLAYDFDGDGRAEVVMKTADGTVDGTGQVIGDPNADYRDGYTGAGDGRWGRILTGPEYLTVFDGVTGAALATTNFQVARGSVSSWGDSYGNRVDRFLATVAYLDGVRPSLVMARGYYERTTLTAWNWRDGQLTRLWTFDSEDATPDPAYEGQGNHSLAVGDVDNDGKDEIIYGAAVIDDNGSGIYATGYGHGDAMHFGDLVPSRPGLEVFQIHEPSLVPGSDLRDARTGATIAATAIVPSGVEGPGRGVALDIDPNYPGYEFWHSGSSIYGARVDGQGNVTYAPIYDQPSRMHQNYGVWWDADLLRETLDGTTIGDWNYITTARQNLVGPTVGGAGSFNDTSGLSSNNGSKATPSLSADILGDWREEVIWRRTDNSSLQIWTTATPAANRIYTLMHDPIYRMAIAWQNGAYNQPPHPGFFLGANMAAPPVPQIYTVRFDAIDGDYNGNGKVDAADYVVWRKTLGSTANLGADGSHNRVVDDDDHAVWRVNFGDTGAPEAAASWRILPIADLNGPEPSSFGTALNAESALPTGRSTFHPSRIRKLTEPASTPDPATLAPRDQAFALLNLRNNDAPAKDHVGWESSADAARAKCPVRLSYAARSITPESAFGTVRATRQPLCETLGSDS